MPIQVSPSTYSILGFTIFNINMGFYQQNMSSNEAENVPTMNVNQESATMRKDTAGMDLYAILDISKNAGSKEIKRAYRNLATKEHPDKGGSLERFRLLQQAYETLSDPDKKRVYDETGQVMRTAEEEFIDGFGGGNFRDRGKMAPQMRANLSEQLAVRQVDQSHTAGFEAWMRSRGQDGVQTFTSEDIIDQFGVVKGSYEPVVLPKIKAYTVMCQRAGLPKEVLTVDMQDIPAQLEWGEVLVSMRVMPINPADLYTIHTGGLYGNDPPVKVPFVPGHDGIGVVVKGGPGVKDVREGDWVIPLKSNMGTWRSLAAFKAKDVLVIPADVMPMDQAALIREMITAYRLLEDANLKPGDCVILNGANGTIGQFIIQLCHVLRLRAVAVVSPESDFDKTSAWLKKLGAVHVIRDQGSIKGEMNKLKFFAKPKLGLDCIGGDSGVRVSEAMSADGAHMVIYGCMSGRSPNWNWKSWVFGGMKIKGFNTRKWISDNQSKVPKLVETLGKLVRNNTLSAQVTEYEMATDFDEALDHAMDRGKNTKVLLKVSDVGEHA